MGSDVITHSYEIFLIQHIHTHSAYSYAFTQGRNNMHAQKNMNVYNDITLSYEIVHIQHIHTHSVYSYAFTQGCNNMHVLKNMNA